MSGINPYQYMQQLAAQIDSMETPERLNRALDEMEYLFEIIPPELQSPAEELIARLRQKLGLN
ncbi:hypothetical protein D5085_17765 [Ectothiorhodospiraceae bacterium BW-2]|nr:hypothetical protein D5085_17765 [Ectothiorhodospiraceae bacterium BW-2]